eukprot:gene9174-1262_t
MRTVYKMKNKRTVKFISASFCSLGLFAGAGSMYMWGEGALFNQISKENKLFPLHVSELLITTPSSIISSIGIFKMKKWGIFSSFFTLVKYIKEKNLN